VAARNPTEQRLTEIWEQELGLDRVGIHDNFFDLGGDSIFSIQIISKAYQAGLQCTLQQQFEFPTIAELAPIIERATPETKLPDSSKPHSPRLEFSLAKLGQESMSQILKNFKKGQR